MKAKNPEMHFEYVPKPKVMGAGEDTIFPLCILYIWTVRESIQALL
jgi:hypothetical protein